MGNESNGKHLLPEKDLIFKIRHKETGKFACGTNKIYWNDYGKRYFSLRNLILAISQNAEVFRNCEIIKYRARVIGIMDIEKLMD